MNSDRDVHDDLTARLSLGMATLMRLPLQRQQHEVLRSAARLGLLNIDTAPIYGLGQAECCIGEFQAKQTSVRFDITTKVGITKTLAGRIAGRVQGPVRAAIKRSPVLRGLGRAASGGMVGQASPGAYQSSFDNSLRAMRQTTIPALLAHDIGWNEGGAELLEFLKNQRELGFAGRVGVAGEASLVRPWIPRLPERSILQVPAKELFRLPPEQHSHSIRLYGLISSFLEPTRISGSSIFRQLKAKANLLSGEIEESTALVALLIHIFLAEPVETIIVGTTQAPRLEALVTTLNQIGGDTLESLPSAAELVEVLRDGR